MSLISPPPPQNCHLQLPAAAAISLAFSLPCEIETTEAILAKSTASVETKSVHRCVALGVWEDQYNHTIGKLQQIQAWLLLLAR